MRWKLVVILGLLCCGCTKKLHLNKVDLMFKDGKLATIAVSAPTNDLHVTAEASAVYLSLFPCNTSRRNKIFYGLPNEFSVERPGSGKVLIIVEEEDPQPKAAERWKYCAQIVADSMSIYKYRSNVVLARKTTYSK